jgi:DNA-binding PadR family transcriptional regulator
MPRKRHLTTTSFAILGLLALRRWPVYELAKQVKRSLSHFWPRAESNLYAEAKRLVGGGYAAAERLRTGERARTVYAITPKGRAALRDWLAQPGGEVRFESEPLLKVFFADQGSPAALRATIVAIGATAAQQQAGMRAIAAEYRAGTGPFPERLALALLSVRQVWDQLAATASWSRRALRTVQRWKGAGAGEPPLWPPGIVARSRTRAAAPRRRSTRRP